MAKESMRVKVVSIGETKEVGNNGFKKRVLEGRIEGEYPEDFAFEFTKDKVALLDNVLEDTYVTVHFNIRGRKVSEDKNGVVLAEPLFFVTLNGWKVEV